MKNTSVDGNNNIKKKNRLSIIDIRKYIRKSLRRYPLQLSLNRNVSSEELGLEVNCFNAQVESIPFAHQWIIRNFSCLCSVNFTGQPYIRTSKFSSKKSNNPKIEFVLLLYPNGDCSDNENEVSLCLQLESSEQNCITVQQRFYFLDKEGNKCFVKGACNPGTYI